MPRLENGSRPYRAKGRDKRAEVAVDNPGAFLSRTVTRLCLDALKSARRKRETYVGLLLHDVFGVGLDEIARALEREPEACRKRAREHVREARPRYDVTPERSAQIAHAFYVAARAGDISGLRQLLAEDVVVYSDGGGKRSVATKPINGRARAERFYVGIARKHGFRAARFYRPVQIDGLPGFISAGTDGIPQTTALALDNEQIVAISRF